MTSGITLPDPALVARDRGIKLPCQEHDDPDLWFPEGPSEQAEKTASKARLLCVTCPLRVMCRDHALGTPEPYGIRGGLTETNRHTVRKGRRLRDPVARWLAGQADLDAPAGEPTEDTAEDTAEDTGAAAEPDEGELAPVEDIPSHLIPTARAMEILGLTSQPALAQLLRRYGVQPAERARRGSARTSHLYDLGDILRVKDQKKTYTRRASA